MQFKNVYYFCDCLYPLRSRCRDKIRYASDSFGGVLVKDKAERKAVWGPEPVVDSGVKPVKQREG
jgi:hypothetical protein